MHFLRSACFLMLPLLIPFESIASDRSNRPDTCTYSVSVWNTVAGKVTRTIEVKKKYSTVAGRERDRFEPSCTACIEDQTEINVPGIESFYVCSVIADKVKTALIQLINQGEPIISVSGYRPVLSKGILNSNGERTELSNHSFGTAIDINRMQNGLYNNCFKWGPQCELVLGGPWRPGVITGSLSPEGKIVQRLKSLGFKWGGEIEASQKDFMHFSFSGF